MNRNLFHAGQWISIVVVGMLLSGCAYFNTMYNAQKRFEEAEREVEAAPRQTAESRPSQQSTAQTRPVPIEKYRKVIETCAKLLENHPKSRWVDDALLLMGISYYRINDLARAERKFSELSTLFPSSSHITTALIWKARVLAEQKRPEEAIELLSAGKDQMKPGSRKAEALFILGNLYYDSKKWGDAADQFRLSLRQKQRREQRNTTLYRYGLALFKSGKYDEARDALSQTAKASNDLAQAYDAYVYWSRSELALRNYTQAEAILLRVRSSERFLDFIDDIELELANLALETGRIDDALNMYQDYITRHTTGEGRGLAFYRLANIYRYQRVNLTLAKSLLDSVVRCGAAREIVDSTRYAIDQISKGLIARENMLRLIQSIEALKSETGQNPLPQEQTSHPPAPLSAVETPDQHPDSLTGAAVSEAEIDTVIQEQLAGAADSTKRLSPAALAADSMLRSLRARKTIPADTSHDDTDKEIENTSHQPASATTQPGQQRESIESLQSQLQRAYLLIAEFYEYNISDHDSARYYYELAAASPLNAAVYWKANLFLARQAARTDSVLTDEAAARYRIVAAAEGVPIEASNEARNALGLPLLDKPVSPQHAALRAAENAQSSGQVPADSLLWLYTNVIQMDSLTRDGQSALFAKAHIYEHILHQFDSANVIYGSLFQQHRDSSFASWLEVKTSPPDSNSIFLRPDKELFGKKEAVETILQPDKSKDGWPPPEEALRGRRYR